MKRQRIQWRIGISFLVTMLLFLFLEISSVHAAGPINWFTTSTVSSVDSPAWGRMLPWDKQGDNLITYTAYPANSAPVIKVARSNPSNPTYTDIASIPSPGGHIQEQSQMVQFSNGDILMAMRNRQTDLNWFGLPIVKSTDGGHTWNYVSQLDTNPNSKGRFNRGLWEPFLSILPNRCVAGFYASEKHADDNTSYNQVVSERVSCDEGATWGPEIYAAAQPGNARPGMPGLAQMANGRFILVFEVCGTDNCNVHYKTSGDGTSWSNDLGTNIPDQRSGPYVTVLSSGRILVSSGGTNQVSFSDNNGANWNLNDPPAFQGSTDTWPAIYQTGLNKSNEVGIVVNINGAIQIRFGKY